jgi:hypothetical protein
MQQSGAEIDVLLQCVGAATGRGRPRSVDRIAVDGVDWNRLLEIALRHGVVPLLYRVLANRHREAVPSIVLGRLASQYRANAANSQRLLRELLDLLALFESSGIRTISLRGPLLAQSIYGDVAARQFSDLDLFVQAYQAEQAKALLIARGYRFCALRETDALAESADGRIGVDLQWALARRVWSFPIDIDQLWDAVEPVTVGNRLVWQPKAAEQALILCAHASKHCWSSLKLVSDIAAFIEMHRSRLDWSSVAERARSLGGQRQLLLGLKLSADLLNVEIPDHMAQRVEADRVVPALSSELQRRLFATVERPSHQGSYSYTAGGLFYIRTRERLRDKIPCALDLFRYQFTRLRELVVPNVHDRSVVALPASLAPLYYVVRPVRLTRQLVVSFVRRQTAEARPSARNE